MNAKRDRTDDPTAASGEKKPCDHKPDFYPSIMQWQCSVCGVPLRVTLSPSAWQEAMSKQTEKAKEQQP